MKDQLKRRLEELKAEYEAGQNLLNELEAKQASTQQTVLRISGAIQVLEELLNQATSENKDGKVSDAAITPSVTTG